MGNEKFILFGRETCNFCVLAADFLSASHKEYFFLDFEDDPLFEEEAKEFYSMKTIPIILTNDTATGLVRKIGGYTELLNYLK